MLAGHDGAAQVDGRDAVEGGFRDLERAGVAAGKADAHVVVQDVDAAPAFLGFGDRRLQRGFLGHVGLEGDAFAAILRDDRCGLLGRLQVDIDGQDLGAVAREHQCRGPTVAQSLAGALAGADDDGDLVREAHGFLHFFLSPQPGLGRNSDNVLRRSSRERCNTADAFAPYLNALST